MIKEAFVSFEVAKLLKEKGFKEDCSYRYVAEPDYRTPEFVRSPIGKGSRYIYNAPTHQMVMAWLREKYNAVIVIDVCRETGREGFYCWQLEDNRTGDWIDNIVGECPTYEQACEAALKYCLENLI